MLMNDKSLAFVFPGQGSQSVGMLQELAVEYPVVPDTFQEASDVLGYDLWRLVVDGPAEQLNQTEYTQPAMLVAGVAAWRVWCESSPIRPVWMAGHSLGEYTALVCAGALTFADAVGLVRERASLMQGAVPSGVGAMAAILGIDDAKVLEICRQISTVDSVVTAANFNAPGQIVVAGHKSAVEQCAEAAKRAGARRAVLLPVSVPSHCPLMAAAAGQFLQRLEAVSVTAPDQISVVHNVDVSVQTEAAAIRERLAQQLYSSVRWSETVAWLVNQGITRFVECGPGKVLAGLGKRIAANTPTEPLYSPDSLKKVLEMVNG
jgi:[acyl-carrier-protein] S-malonyltransferase